MVNAIAPSALPVSTASGAAPSVLSLEIAAPGPADGAIGSEQTFDFAAILGLASASAEEPVSAHLKPLGEAASGKGGNAGGKVLPVALPGVPEVEAASDTAKTDADAKPADEAVADGDAALPALVVWLPLPIATALPTATPAPDSPMRPATAPPVGTDQQIAVMFDPRAGAEGQAPSAMKAPEIPAQTQVSASPTPQLPADEAVTPVREPAEPRPAPTTRPATVAASLAAPATAIVLAARAPAAEMSAKAALPTAPVQADGAPDTSGLAPAPVAPAQPTTPADRGNGDAPQGEGRAHSHDRPTDPLATLRAATPLFAADIAGIAPAASGPVVTSATPGPGTAPTPAQSGIAPPQDLATLVERLVEARQAAAPQAVAATIAHGEFGRVGLSFQQDGGGLAVSMTSADPGFAPAVQAAAASVPSGLMQDSGANQQRQDARQDARADQNQSPASQGQHAASGGSQPQGQSQQARRSDSQPLAGRQVGPEPETEIPAGRADGGIYV